MNKRGELVLRDVVFMMMMVSAIFVLSGLFVSDLAFSYDNTNMSSEWALSGTNTLANSTFYDTGDNITSVGVDLGSKSTGIWALISSVANSLEGIGDALFMVLTAPNTIGDLVGGTLEDAGVASSVSNIIKYLIVIVFWVIIIFTIVSAFLRGGKL
jgi:hypothetical protein